MTDFPIDPALAHLYADEPDDDEIDLRERAERQTSLDALTEVDESGAEEDLSDRDLDELAILVGVRLDTGGLPDLEAAALGLGRMVGDELVYNRTGREVIRRLVASRYPDLEIRPAR